MINKIDEEKLKSDLKKVGYIISDEAGNVEWDKINQITEKCNCWAIQGIPRGKVFFHLLGCEVHYDTKKYDHLKWWKKMFKKNPRRNLLNYFWN